MHVNYDHLLDLYERERERERESIMKFAYNNININFLYDGFKSLI